MFKSFKVPAMHHRAQKMPWSQRRAHNRAPQHTQACLSLVRTSHKVHVRRAGRRRRILRLDNAALVPEVVGVDAEYSAAPNIPQISAVAMGFSSGAGFLKEATVDTLAEDEADADAEEEEPMSPVEREEAMPAACASGGRGAGAGAGGMAMGMGGGGSKLGSAGGAGTGAASGAGGGALTAAGGAGP